MNPLAVIPTDETELLIKLNSHLLLRAAKDVARWVMELPRSERPLFVTVNVSGTPAFPARVGAGNPSHPRPQHRARRHDETEISEALLMDNPEQAVEVLKRSAVRARADA